MGGKRPKVVVQGPTPEELAQRQAQFNAQMAALEQQSSQQQTALMQQLQQQRQAAEAQQKALQQQLTAAGNVNANNALQLLMQALTQQTAVSQEGFQEREAQEALGTQQARTKTRANVEKRKASESFADLLTTLQSRRRA